MGAWGTGIWDNDSALDVKDVFKDLIDKNIELEEVFTQVYDWLNAREYLGGHTDTEDYLFAIVMLQIENDIYIFPELFDKAKDVINDNARLQDWRDPKEREKSLNEFKRLIMNFQAQKKGIFIV